MIIDYSQNRECGTKLAARLIFLSTGTRECLTSSSILGHVKHEKCTCDIRKIAKIIVSTLHRIRSDMIPVCQ